MVSSVSNKNNNQQHSTVLKTLCGGAIGMAIPTAIVCDTFTPVTVADAKETAEGMRKFMPDMDTFENTKANIQKLLKDTGLEKKGVKLLAHDGTSESDKALRDILNQIDPSTKKLNQIVKDNLFNTTKYGANACFISNSNTIHISRRNLYTSAYHELGHAMNAKTNIFSKALAKARGITPYGISILAPITLAVGLFHKIDKNKPIEQKDKKEQTLDFVANNAGKLTLASYVPLLGEEGLASIRGLKQAKKVLPEDKLSKLAKNYFKAWGTYAKLAAAVSAAVGFGVMVSNGSMKNFENNQSDEL
ncbi:MAG: hypothetical protein NC200_07755 [Candidatus Gastranaerophilales bacterium]|nr:hypothetical protein [Candidatus Gastranaerophilales bacterium]